MILAGLVSACDDSNAAQRPERVDIVCIDGTKYQNMEPHPVRNDLIVLFDTNKEAFVVSGHQCALIGRPKQ